MPCMLVLVRSLVLVHTLAQFARSQKPHTIEIFFVCSTTERFFSGCPINSHSLFSLTILYLLPFAIYFVRVNIVVSTYHEMVRAKCLADSRQVQLVVWNV